MSGLIQSILYRFGPGFIRNCDIGIVIIADRLENIHEFTTDRAAEEIILRELSDRERGHINIIRISAILHDHQGLTDCLEHCVHVMNPSGNDKIHIDFGISHQHP